MTDIKKILAKSNISIIDHTKMVLNMGMEIGTRYFDFPENFKERLALALILHDIGKCSTSFQTYIKKCSIDSEGLENGEKTKWYYHNTLSWAFAVSCIKGLRKSKYSSVTSSVLYHHIVRDDMTNTALDIIRKFIDKEYDAYRNMCEFYTLMLDYTSTTFGINFKDNDDYSLIQDIDDFQGEHTKIEDETLYEKIDLNNVKNRDYLEKYSVSSVIRAILIYCDREISSGKFDNQKILENNAGYIDEVFTAHRYSALCEPDYSAYDEVRLSKQIDAVNDILKCGINTNVLQASAGFGKTLMGLIWFFKNREKILWVLPRNIIGTSTYNSVVSELETMGVSDKIRVALYFTGQVQQCNYCTPEECHIEDCDILILNIDSFLSFYSKNNIANLLIDHYSKNIIIDEYHEMVSDAPLFSAYCNMLYTRMHYTNTKTLLLSATAVPIDNLIFGNETNIKHWSLPIYGGETKVNVHFIDKDDLAKLNLKDNTFIILSTIKDAQLMYRLIPGDDRLLLHSRYLPQDRKDKENLLYSMYGKHSKNDDNKMPVIATSVIGVGLDVSASTIYDECISPEDTIQRGCGRGSRFCEYEVIDYYVITNKKENKKHINNVYNSSLHNKWINVLREYDGKQITKEYLYDLYDKFYNDNKKEYDKYLNNQYDLSSTALSEIKLKHGSSYSDDKEITIANGMTYRGSNTNIFVTVKKNKDYIEPIIVDTYLLEDETDTNENNKKRYEFLKSKLGEKSGKYILRNGFGIRNHYDANAKNCAKLAYTSNTPLLLCDYIYTQQIGLEFIGGND